MTGLSASENDPIPLLTPSEGTGAIAPGSDADPLEIHEFLESTNISTESQEPNFPNVIRTDPAPCWYCGVAEATGWWIGALLVHLAASVAIVIGLLVLNLSVGNARSIDINNPRTLFSITAGEMTIFVLAAMLAVSLRFWGRTFAELNFSRPDSRHIWMVIGGTLPLTICVSAWSVPIQIGWKYLTEAIPFLQFFDSFNSMTMVKEMAANTPLIGMILVVAVLPAIGEELIFRGAIGHALIANLGVWGGVLVTSFLFGWIHIHPVHALSVIPLGLAMHLVYLWSRSFWLPMLLHFVNNFWATVSAQNDAVDPIRDGVQLHLIDGIMMAMALVATVALTRGFFQSRNQLIDADGRSASTGRFPVRVSTSPGVRTVSDPIETRSWQIALTCTVFCHLIVLFDLINNAMAHL